MVHPIEATEARSSSLSLLLRKEPTSTIHQTQSPISPLQCSIYSSDQPTPQNVTLFSSKLRVFWQDVSQSLLINLTCTVCDFLLYIQTSEPPACLTAESLVVWADSCCPLSLIFTVRWLCIPVHALQYECLIPSKAPVLQSKYIYIQWWCCYEFACVFLTSSVICVFKRCM